MSEDWAGIALEVKEGLASLQDVNSPDLVQGTLVQNGANTGTNADPTYAYVETSCTVTIVEYKASEIDGTVIQRGDTKILTDATIAVVPEPGDSVVVDDVTYAVIDAEVVRPAGVPVLYIVQGRG